MIEHKIPIIRNRLQQLLHENPAQIIYINIEKQKLYFVREEETLREYDISTSKFGTGNLEHSNMTPTGIHRITNKIGHGAPCGRIFRSRIDTGEDCHEGITEENLITTRILRLEGLETGVNKGGQVDSFERYIYIHGTNREDLIGTPMSHGCICMRNNDIIDLFNSVTEGTIVVID